MLATMQPWTGDQTMERFKHWQLFLIFFAPLFIALHLEDQFYKGILQSISLSFVVIYLLSIGEYLHGIKEISGHNFFRLNCFYLVIVIILIGIVGDFVSADYLVVGLVSVAYALLATIQVIDHVAILIRANENKELDNHKQKVEFMLLFFWPVGIWFLQPRINKIS
jgi:hypothetical protein